MPLFALLSHDAANSTEQRAATRPEHVERLKKLEQEGRLKIAGPCPIVHGEPAMSGSVIIAEFDSLKEAQTWAQADPYLRDGVYTHTVVKPFIQALPAL